MIENWNRHIRERGDHLETDELRQEANKILESRPSEWDRIPKLEKTEQELKIIGELNQPLNQYLDFMGVDRLEIDESDIDIVDEVYFRNNFGDQGGIQDGSGLQSHIIIPRYLDEHKFVSILTHEMIHGVAYQRSSAEFRIKNGQIFKYRLSDHVRMGFRFERRSEGVEDAKISNYFALNEAMTEFIAYRVRKYFYLAKSFDKGAAEVQADMGAYTIEFGILNRVLQKYKQLGNDEQELMVDIQRGYFLGDMTPLKKLQIVHPDAVRLLRDMKHSDFNSLIETAEGFGLTEYADFLKDKREKLA